MLPCMATADDVDAAATVARSIGRRVRTSRTELGWTLDQLAQRSGVSRRMLVNVEQGSTNPSIATLLRLSDALGIGLPALVDVGTAPEDAVSVHRSGEIAAMWTSASGGSAVMVAGTRPPDVVELWDWRLGPADIHRSDPHRAGTTELMLVVSGSVVLVVDGTEHRLAAGDSASYVGDVAHSYRNPSTARPARFTLSVYEPRLTQDAT
jgi:transcriptional regulator with XRE-family HTH domain